MKNDFLRTAALVSAIHVLLLLGCFAYLKATGFQLFTFLSLFGLEALPTNSFSQELAFNVMALISYPLASVAVSVQSTVLLILLSVATSILWGLCFAAAFSALRRCRLNPGLHWTAR
jgi:hypothetical protein